MAGTRTWDENNDFIPSRTKMIRTGVSVDQNLKNAFVSRMNHPSALTTGYRAIFDDDRRFFKAGQILMTVRRGGSILLGAPSPAASGPPVSWFDLTLPGRCVGS